MAEGKVTKITEAKTESAEKPKAKRAPAGPKTVFVVIVQDEDSGDVTSVRVITDATEAIMLTDQPNTKVKPTQVETKKRGA